MENIIYLTVVLTLGVLCVFKCSVSTPEQSTSPVLEEEHIDAAGIEVLYQRAKHSFEMKDKSIMLTGNWKYKIVTKDPNGTVIPRMTEAKHYDTVVEAKKAYLLIYQQTLRHDREHHMTAID